MARTKSRSPRPAAAPVRGRTNVTIVVTPGTTRPQPVFGPLLHRGFRVLSSLQLAIGLLSLFTLCLIVATLLESAYSTKIAQDLIYRTWWFSLLLVFLAANVLGAALKKYPWKKSQTGFLITHSGLLVLVFGGLFTTV